MPKQLLRILASALTALCLFAVHPACATQTEEQISLAAEESGASSRPLLTLMYHNLAENRKSKYSVSPNTFREDLVLLKKFGYRCVTAKNVIDFAAGKGRLPDRPVLITFDDGHYNNLRYAADILKEEGFTALVSVIGQFSENTTRTASGGNVSYSHLTWTQIRQMAESGLFEIGNHTYNMHNYKPRFGVTKKAGESDAEYRKALSADAGKLQSVLKTECGVAAKVFAIPFGGYSALTLDILAENGFQMLLTSNTGITSVERGNPKSLRLVKRYNRDPELDMTEFLKKLSKKTPLK